MIRIDLHNHTSFSHAKNTVAEMFASGREKGLEIHGFSEHSPRPAGYDYPTEYREALTRGFPLYVEQVSELARKHPGEVLLGIEVDWFEDEVPFVERVLAEYPFDYAIGGIHFLKRWGFDFQAADWEAMDTPARFAAYEAYYATMTKMAEAGLFQIVAHPDLIKLFTRDTFAAWLELPQSREQVRRALGAVGEAGMALEISSAGLRKVCAEIYPCPTVMTIAAELGLPVTLGSDAHNVADMAFGFDQLEAYARGFGYSHSVWFRQGQRQERAF